MGRYRPPPRPAYSSLPEARHALFLRLQWRFLDIYCSTYLKITIRLIAKKISIVSRFITASAMFSYICTLPMHIMPAATDNLTAWYDIKVCFQFNRDYNLDVLFTTLLLSHNTFTCPVIATPKIYSLYRSDTILSMFYFIAMNSLKKTRFYRVLLLYVTSYRGSVKEYHKLCVEMSCHFLGCTRSINKCYDFDTTSSFPWNLRM